MSMKQKNLFQLFVPIALETLCFMLTGMIDTMMLSSVSDAAVGAVGTANTYISVFIIMFNIISSGMIAVMTQYIGAGKNGIACQTMKIGAVFNAALGIGLSVFLCFFSENILELVGVAPLLMEYAKTYLQIVGGCCFLNALIPIFSSYLRAFGYTKQPLVATMVGNLINLILNAVFLFVLHWGVAGVAIATVISRVCNFLIVLISSRILVHTKAYTDRMRSGEIIKQIIRIGLPSACETALYNIAMTLTIRFLNQMDANGVNVTARAYAMQIANFSFCVGAALAQANAILTGWRVGAKDYEACDRGTIRAAIIGIFVATILETAFAVCSVPIMHWFSDDPIMISLVGKLLYIDIILEMGRVTNLVFGQALKTSGDAVYPVIIGCIFMYLCMVFGTYFFGIKLELMAVGAYIGMALDECVRAVFMVLRWKTGIWRKKGLV